jgi:hypothetical protein
MAEQTADPYTQTRRCLHGLAELVLAGPRFRQTGDLRLRVRQEGIGTWDEPVISLARGELVTPDARIPVDGLTISEVARKAGLEVSALDDVYSDGPHVDPSETVRLDPGSVGVMEDAVALGDRALHGFRPDAERTLWPEHFDVATTVDAVNFGVSPGDGHCDRPYAYVGPHHVVTGDFWNAPFGASRLVADLGDVAGITAFFVEGARLAAVGRP